MSRSKINRIKRISFPFALAACSFLFMGSCSNGNKEKSGESPPEKPVAEMNGKSEAAPRESASYAIKDGEMVSAAGRPMVVDFYADWCPPCRQMKPIFETFAEKYKGTIDFVSVDVDNNRELALKYGVQSIPTFVFVSPEGKVVDKIIGAVSQSDFSMALSSYFPEQAGE